MAPIYLHYSLWDHIFLAPFFSTFLYQNEENGVCRAIWEPGEMDLLYLVQINVCKFFSWNHHLLTLFSQNSDQNEENGVGGQCESREKWIYSPWNAFAHSPRLFKCLFIRLFSSSNFSFFKKKYEDIEIRNAFQLEIRTKK